MWRWLVRVWRAMLARPASSPDTTPQAQIIPAELLAGLQRLVEDELKTRERKRKADRFQRAGATAIAAVVVSIAILSVILADQPLPPGSTPSRGASFNLEATLAIMITVAVIVWNALGWWGAREAVRFSSQFLILGWAVLFSVWAARVGFGLLLDWSAGHSVLTTWAKDAAWGAVASSLLPLLIWLGIAIGTGFLPDEFAKPTSGNGMSRRTRVSLYVYVICGLLGGIVAAFVVGNVTSLPLRSPELTTAVFAFPYVSSWLSVLASIPVAFLAFQRSTAKGRIRN